MTLPGILARTCDHEPAADHAGLATPLAGDPPGSDLDRLQGDWVMVAMEREGESTCRPRTLKGGNAVYEGNKITLRDGERVRRRRIVTLDASRKPKAINTWDRDGPYEDQTVPGIYELDGDTLRLCFGRPGSERPKEFTTKTPPGVLFCVYKRRRAELAWPRSGMPGPRRGTARLPADDRTGVMTCCCAHCTLLWDRRIPE